MQACSCTLMSSPFALFTMCMQILFVMHEPKLVSLPFDGDDFCLLLKAIGKQSPDCLALRAFVEKKKENESMLPRLSTIEYWNMHGSPRWSTHLLPPHLPGCFDTQARLNHHPRTYHAASSANDWISVRKAFLCPKQTRISTMRHEKVTTGCCLRVTSRHACATAAQDRAVTFTCTHRYQPLQSPWTFQRRAVAGSWPCQSSTSDSQQVPMTGS